MLLVAVGYWLRTPEIVLTIESRMGEVDVYAGPQYLGTTPLYLSKRQVGRFRLEDSSLDVNALKWIRNNGCGYLISPPKGPGTLLWFKAPEGSEDNLFTDETPWGRAIWHDSQLANNGHVTLLTFQPRTMPIRGQIIVPATVSHESKSVRLQFDVHNAGSAEWRPESPLVTADIRVGSFSSLGGVVHSRQLAWNTELLAPGGQAVMECTIPTPNVPGEYALQTMLLKLDGTAHSPRFPVVVLRVE